MAQKIFCITLLSIIIEIQAYSEIIEIQNVNENEAADLIKLLQASPQVLEKKNNDGDMNLKALNVMRDREDYESNGISDRMCKITGRCGCPGGRCGMITNKNSLEDVYAPNIIQKLKELTQKGKINSAKKRNSCLDGHCRDDVHKVRSNSDVDLKYQLQKYGKKYKINEDMDAIILNLDDINEKSSKYTPFMTFGGLKGRNINYMKNKDEVNNIKILDGNDSLLKDKSDKLAYKSLNSPLGLNVNEPEKPTQYELQLSPEDLAEYYNIYKHDLTNKVIQYLKDTTGIKNLIKFPEKQQNLLNNLKTKILKGDRFDNEQLELEIAGILFGTQSDSQILPHNVNNDNIYIPQWFYEAIVNYIKQKYLRRNNRVFPLTVQQRQRLMKKNLRSVWRRNNGANIEQSGFPFELNLTGLGQAVP